MSNKVFYNRAQLIEAIRNIDSVVVSLDRLGSSIAHSSPALQAAETERFLSDFDVFRKLSTARTILCDAFDAGVGESQMDELERELADNEYWSPN